MKIRKGDRVRVLSGKDKGREGKVSTKRLQHKLRLQEQQQQQQDTMQACNPCGSPPRARAPRRIACL